jgi:hypothetical protein
VGNDEKEEKFCRKEIVTNRPKLFFNHYEAEVFEMSEKLDQPMFVYKSSWV